MKEGGKGEEKKTEDRKTEEPQPGSSSDPEDMVRDLNKYKVVEKLIESKWNKFTGVTICIEFEQIRSYGIFELI